MIWRGVTEHHESRWRHCDGCPEEVARPALLAHWWSRWWARRLCVIALGHCWHPEGMIDWWCCVCSAEVDGMPEQRCMFCRDKEGS